MRELRQERRAYFDLQTSVSRSSDTSEVLCLCTVDEVELLGQLSLPSLLNGVLALRVGSGAVE